MMRRALLQHVGLQGVRVETFRVYWRAYGGWFALITSPYFLCAGIFAALCKPLWFDGAAKNFPWTDWALSLLSSLISFSIGGLAVILAFSNEKFVRLIRQNGKENSYFMVLTTAFFHFILVQFIAIALVIILISYQTVFLSGVAFWVFSYAIACGIAAAASLLESAHILNRMGILDVND